MSIDRRLTLLVLLAVAGSSPLTASVNGSEDVQVNTGTAGAQSSPAVAVAGDGHFLVVWESESSAGSDTDGWSIQGRCFDANGEPLADDFQVNTVTTGDQQAPSLAATADGGFVVVWVTEETDYWGYGSACLSLQLLESNGAPHGGEVTVAYVDTTHLGGGYVLYRPARVAAGPDGCLVAWTPEGTAEYACGSYCIWCTKNRIVAKYLPGCNAPPVDDTGLAYDEYSSACGGTLLEATAIGNLPNGEFVVSWHNFDMGYLFEPESAHVEGQRMANGTPVGSAFPMTESEATTETIYARSPPVQSLVVGPAGEMVPVWRSRTDPSSVQIRARILDSTGQPVISPFRVDALDEAEPQHPATAVDPEAPDAGFIVVWDSQGSLGSDSSGTSIQARWIGWDGTPLEEQFQVNSFTPLGQSQPAVAKGVAVWTSELSPGSDSSGSSILGRFLPRAATLSLLGWWQGEVDATDSSGLGNNGTLEGGLGFASGVSGRAFACDGVDDAVIVPDAASLDLGEGDFSVTYWVRTAGQYPILLDKRSANPCNGFMAYLQAGHPGLRICEPSGASQFTSSAFVADEDFHHVAVTVERASPTGGRIWVDGELVHTFDPTPRQGWLANEVPLTIGRQGDDFGGLGHLQGILDDVRLYGRALSEADVHALAAARGDSIFWDDLELGTTLSWSLAVP